MRETTWDLDHLALEVPATRARVTGGFVVLSLALAATVIGLRLGWMGAAGILVPAALLARQLLSPLQVVVGFRGVRVGRRWFPRSEILSATATGGRARLALTDGRIVGVPLEGRDEREAFVAALARPATLFEGVHAREALRDTRVLEHPCA